MTAFRFLDWKPSLNLAQSLKIDMLVGGSLGVCIATMAHAVRVPITENGLVEFIQSPHL